MPDPIRVAVIDDHPLFREGVIAALQADHDIDVIAEGGSAPDAVQAAAHHLPEVMLLDLHLPGGGLEALREVAASYPATRVVMLTFSEDEADVLAALKAGARGYIIKGVTGRELRGVIRAVSQGEVSITPMLASGLLYELARPEREPPGGLMTTLTARERQILEGVAAGRSNKEIARELELTEKTVKHYMTNVLQKLQVRNRVEAALLAQREMQRQK
ncbi:LuxR C-terminal-related transcriptional regulator [Deinococcus maricopensis]|uniref:Two component transcriptional regulator, LuxR family n=1 Tax=Deinococcus maricopensis (strain DSM 21211 / LMG 22137 / NRRL B-23946 / LB-34) TaxID=709986 RepID=E8U4W1_DEIML|nr:response regulator transcription factor [Deinococcus maricopensis]ADV66100.1 two component transcriptional regulator, LuxR family [Deinococcus maricopensis DSM 21211]